MSEFSDDPSNLWAIANGIRSSQKLSKYPVNAV